MTGKDNMTEEQKQALKQSLQSFITQLSLQQAAENEQEKKEFKFWKTQPVPSLE
jgi:glycylpeptide N-tetradecanoyltransferase